MLRLFQPAASTAVMSSANSWTGFFRRLVVRRACLGIGIGAFLGCAGCEFDSFLDPSVIGRWEHTPTVVPVLERIDVVERDVGEFVEVTPVTPEDLLPEAAEYRTAPGDSLQIEILDFIEAGGVAPYSRVVDNRGYIELPQIGEVFVNGLTQPQIAEVIRRSIQAAGILEDPLVAVEIPGRRQSTFSIFGAITNPGRYLVPSPDYRLLQALTDAGGVSPVAPKVFIIRQVPLTQEAEGPRRAPQPTLPQPIVPRPTGPAPGSGQAPGTGPSITDLIEELTKPAPDSTPPEPPRPERPKPEADKPESQPPDSPGLSQTRTAPELGVWGNGEGASQPRTRPPARRMVQAQQGGGGVPSQADQTRSAETPSGQPPPIDLPEEPGRPIPRPSSQLVPSEPVAMPPPAPTRWVFINGQWVQVMKSGGPDVGLPEGEEPLKAAPPTPGLVAQRVIGVPTGPLLQGVAQYNVIVRPGDVINVPSPTIGFVYVGGPGILRPGVYQLPGAGRLTLLRLVMSAGGLGPIAIPRRVDLTRMVGDDRQATVRLDLKAIAEGTQPDLFIKPDDMINIGTNFWATPLAILRGGLRMSYGYGFILDRNFGNDVFGAPPTNITGQ